MISLARAASNETVQIQSLVEKREPRSAKIRFEKIILQKNDIPPDGLRGSIAITNDYEKFCFAHVLFYIGQWLSAVFSGREKSNITLCHAQVILGKDGKPRKKDNLVVAHAYMDGVKTYSENLRRNDIINEVIVYKPVDERIRNLFAKFAEQTAVYMKKTGGSRRLKNDPEWIKKKVPSYSITKMISSLFYRQVAKPNQTVQMKTAYAAADLLRGDKFRNKKGALRSFFCTGYLMTLMQGTALNAALERHEVEYLKTQSREAIASHIFSRIQQNRRGDFLASTYWENEFMQLDGGYTLTYAAGDVFNQSL